MNTLTFQQWQTFARNISARGSALARARIDAGFALAASVGIPRCGCSLHNASIDDDLKGWCTGNPKRLKVAKKANWMVTEWAWHPTRLADRIVRRAYAKVTWPKEAH
jgi:hypothetical protein